MYTLKEIRKILNIQEQDRNEDSWSDGDAVDAYEGDGKPFKPFEVAILKLIHQNLTKNNMEAVLTDHAYPGEAGRKWQNIAKLIGLSHNVQKGHSMEDIAYDKRYVKWALDNWTEDGDYASIEKPIKVPPKRYEVSREESGSQVEYKEGTVSVVAYDEDMASDTADNEFWDWGGEMETTDYGDYETFDTEITSVDPIEVLSEEKQKKFNKLVKLCQLGEKYTPKMVGGVTKHTLVKFLKENINDMVYIDEPKKKHIKKMNVSLGPLEGFPIDKFKNMPPPENESTETEEEIDYLDSIPVEKGFVNSADDIDGHFKKFLKSKGLEFPGEELKEVIKGVKSIILQLKYHYNRPRPNQIADAKNLKLDSEHLKSAGTPSYPSGHATQGTFIGRYLADLYPEYEKELRQIGEDIAFSRNMAKVHYPSDSEFGKMLGNELYEFVYQPEEELSEQISPETLQDLYAFHGEELNERKFGEKLKDFTHKKKEDLKKFWFELTKVAKRERKETAEAVKILARLIKNRSSVTKEDITFLKQQSGDIARIIALISLGAVSVVIPVGLEKLLNQYGISIMPKQRGKDEDGNEIDDHIDATQDDNLLKEQKEINPELKVGDLIKVLDVGDKAPISPELFTNYVVDKIGEGGWRVEGTMRGVNKWYDLLPENWEDELSWRVDLNGKMFTSTEDEDITKSRISRILRDGDTWIKVNPTKTLTESTQTNQPLKRGDEVMIVDLDHSTQGYVSGRRPNSWITPKTFTPYRIFGITHRQRENWEGPDTDTRIYQLEPVDITDEQRFQDSISGGGRRIGLHMIPGDTWVLQKRPENWYDSLHESKQQEISPKLEIGDKIKVIDIDGEHDRMPKLFTTVYEVIGKEEKGLMRRRDWWRRGGEWYDLLPEGWEEMMVKGEDGSGKENYDDYTLFKNHEAKTIYQGDVWIKVNPTETLNEQQFPFNRNNKDMEREHPEGEPDWSIRRGDQHYAMNVENTPNEPIAAFNNYLVKNSPFIIEGFDFYLSAVPGNMPQSAIVDVYVPMMDDSVVADDIWNNDRIYYKINADNWYSADDRDDSKYEEIKEKLHNLDYNQKVGEFTYYDDFQDQHPEYIEYLKKELGDTNLLNEPGAQYEMIWRGKRTTLKKELESIAKLFGLSGFLINRDPRKPWKRQRDSYGNEKIRPGKLVPRGWPRP